MPRLARVAFTPAASPPAPNAAVRVRLHPLYQQAQTACKAGRYAQAAGLLHRLAALPDLTPPEAAFAREQERICLQDAGLPLPPASASALPAPSVSHPAAPAVPAASLADADCGPRALLLLCEREGIRTDLPQLRRLAGTTKDGTSLAGLETAAHAVGLKAEGVQVSREALPDVDMPALAYVNGNHFVAALSVQGRGEDATATIHDPNAAQEQTIGQERLLRLCSGYLLLAHK